MDALLLFAVSATSLPAISVPADLPSFTPEGLPVGLGQIVGQPSRRLDVLQMAHAFEQAAAIREQGASPGNNAGAPSDLVG